MTSTYRIWPLRFSPQPAAMISFFADLGLSKTFDHENGTFAVFNGRSGSVGVHSATGTASGPVAPHTALNFDTRDLDAAAAELAALGVEASVWDESYGRQGAAKDPRGLVIGLNQDTQEDLYGGYRGYEPGDGDLVAASMDVMAVCFVDDLPAAANFFAGFGFRTAADLTGATWATLRAGRSNGLIGLHSTATADAPARAGAGVRPAGDPFGPPYTVALSLLTSEPLDALAGRLQASGYQAHAISENGRTRLDVTDPDGETIEIHPSE